jgi:hypothetical protein
VLNFCDMFPTRKFRGFVFHILRKINTPSTIVKLKINVPTLIDSLYLLDGPFVC